MKLFRKAVILSHRYLGIVFSLLVIMWFATGITMIYWGGMPRVTPELRLERMQQVDFSRVKLTPAEAAERADLDPIGRATLATLLDRPVYRFGSRAPTTVFADTGDVFDELSVDQAQAVAATFARVPASQVHHVATMRDVDQWTLQTPLPLHKFAIDDREGTELYVQPRSGEVAMMTTRSSRGWAWVSTIPHWLYFTALRTNQPLWYRLLVWTSVVRVRPRRAGPGARRHAAPQAASLSTRPPGSLRARPMSARIPIGIDALALRQRRRLWRVHVDVCVQRPAVDGAVGVDECRGSRAAA